ncbi:protein of unknown function [Pseudomonas sp. NFACC02]|uniref:DUF4123 domain-containing protein n=1 Tax=Pseudomonas TaxID=286 RepID=UPI0007801FCE|nr:MULTISPECIES: DUF4123 domain-containing protein [Pseudomonas]SEQ96494.1 protein of unknown function [Pseudomonas sp. NFACC02]
MSSAPQSNLLLIDGAMRADAIHDVYRRSEVLAIRPLFLNTRFAELHTAGPILISLAESSPLIDETYHRNVHRPDASLLYSTASVDDVTTHLQRFIAPEDSRSGDKVILRFADPLTTLHWLSSYGDAQRDAVLGPIDAWHVPEHFHTWAPVSPSVWQSYVRQTPTPAWDETLTRLGDGQFSALDHATRWGLRERLNTSLEQNYPGLMASIDKGRRTQWLDDRLDEARDWGLNSERGIAIWAEYSLRWGEGFTQDHDGPYHQWLAHVPDALKLTPELRIQKMDNDCLIVNPRNLQ